MRAENTVSILERNNKVAIKAHFISVIVMNVFCILQVAGGYQEGGFALVAMILGFVPVIVEKVIRKKNPEASQIKPLLAIGFLSFYTFALFTSFNNMVFVFVIPMIMIIAIYNDKRYSLFVNGIAVLESVLVVAIGANTGKFGYIGSEYAIIQIVIMIMVLFFSSMTAKTLNANSNQQLAGVEALSGQLQEGIKEIHINLERLSASSEHTANAMQEVSSGIVNTNEAIAEQISQTHQIQEEVCKVNEASDRIVQNMNSTLLVLESGNKNVEQLVEQVEVSVQNGADVATKLETLEHYMAKMNSVVEIIDNVAFNTKILSINARIEAARAGEAGRGFEVVATEITEMSERTADATVQITELIDNVSFAIREVVNVVYRMLEAINAEKDRTRSTSESFDSIQMHTLAVRDHIKDLEENIEQLKAANQLIGDSSLTISNIAEEVAGYTTQTLTLEDENTRILSTIEARMNGLIDLIRE